MKLKAFLTMAFEIINYLEEAEYKSYQEWILDGNKPSEHIYYQVKKFRKIANKWQKMYINGWRIIELALPSWKK